LHPDDWGPVVSLDQLLTGVESGAYWKRVLEKYLRADGCLGLVAEADGKLEGYLFGELRAFEFGSEKCGWIYALGVQPGNTRQGVASMLLAEARQGFLELGVSKVRTMTRRTDVPLLALFRSQGFVGGPFVQLELDITGNGASGEPEEMT
jgi:GNAT superfamily N-acetyltransferase